MAPTRRFRFPHCVRCGEIPLAEHRQVFASINGETKVLCNDHVEITTIGEARPRYLPAVPVQSGRWYVDWDEDLAAIGVIEPVFVEEERIELVPVGEIRAKAYLAGQKKMDIEDLPVDRRIVTVPVLRWQKVAAKTVAEPYDGNVGNEPWDWVGIFWTAFFPVLAILIGLATTYL